MRAEHHEVTNDMSTGSINLFDDDDQFIARLTVIRTNPKGEDVNNYYMYLHRICEQVIGQINGGKPHLTYAQYTGRSPVVGQVYRHYKGNLYEVLGFSTCSETLAAKVLYKLVPPEGGPPYEDSPQWDRPLDMWFEPIDDKGTTRFTEVARS